MTDPRASRRSSPPTAGPALGALRALHRRRGPDPARPAVGDRGRRRRVDAARRRARVRRASRCRRHPRARGGDRADGEIEAIAGVFSHVYRRSRFAAGRRPPLPRHPLPRPDRRRRAPRRGRRLDRHARAGSAATSSATSGSSSSPSSAVELAFAGCRRALMRSTIGDRRRRAAGPRLPARPGRRALAALLPHYVRGPADPPDGAAARSSPSSSPAGRSCRSSGSGCRSPGGRGPGARADRSGCGSSTRAARPTAWT